MKGEEWVGAGAGAGAEEGGVEMGRGGWGGEEVGVVLVEVVMLVVVVVVVIVLASVVVVRGSRIGGRPGMTAIILVVGRRRDGWSVGGDLVGVGPGGEWV